MNDKAPNCVIAALDVEAVFVAGCRTAVQHNQRHTRISTLGRRINRHSFDDVFKCAADGDRLSAAAADVKSNLVRITADVCRVVGGFDRFAK